MLHNNILGLDQDMPARRRSIRTRRDKRKRRVTRRRRGASRRGGALGNIPPAAIVSVQQDPYSARVLVDAETAEDMFEAKGTYLL